MVTFAEERSYAAYPDWVFSAATRAVQARRWPIQAVDQQARSVWFYTFVSAFSMGADLNATVIPTPHGGLLRVTGAPKVSTNFTAGRVERKNINRYFDEVTRQLDSMLAQDPSGAIRPPASDAPLSD